MAQVFRIDRRRDKRRPVPEIAVRIDGQVGTSLDWSLGGLSVESLHPAYKIGDIVAGELGRAGEGGHWLPFMAQVVRRERLSRGAGLHFVDLSTECFDFLEAVLRHRPMPATSG